MTTISKTFTATGTSPSLLIPSPTTTAVYTLSGTFVATIALEYTLTGGQSWINVATLSATVTSAIFVPVNGATYRFNCTAYTSGSAVISLADTLPPMKLYVNDAGIVVMSVDQTGVTIPILTVTALNVSALSATITGALTLPNSAVILTGAGVPVDGVSGTGAAVAGPGSIYLDVTNANMYLNGNTQASPTWKLVTRAA